MPIEPLLSFNCVGAYDDLGKAFEKVIDDLSKTILASAEATVGAEYPEVQATLKVSLLSLASSGIIDRQIGSDHWKAWMAEWGSGSEMDTSNPDLTAYMSSQLWNPSRSGFDITGRPKGPYLGLDGQVHEDHTGTLAGRSLEQLRQYSWFTDWMASVGLPEDAFTPKVPLHFMRQALESNRNLIIDQLNAVLEVFNFGTFFV